MNYQLCQLKDVLLGFTFSDSRDKWDWDTRGVEVFTLSKVGKIIDDSSFQDGPTTVRWNMYLPRKVNILN